MFKHRLLNRITEKATRKSNNQYGYKCCSNDFVVGVSCLSAFDNRRVSYVDANLLPSWVLRLLLAYPLLAYPLLLRLLVVAVASLALCLGASAMRRVFHDNGHIPRGVSRARCLGASANMRVSRGSGHIHRGVSNSSSSIEIIDTVLDFLLGFTHINIVDSVENLAIF